MAQGVFDDEDSFPTFASDDPNDPRVQGATLDQRGCGCTGGTAGVLASSTTIHSMDGSLFFRLLVLFFLLILVARALK